MRKAFWTVLLCLFFFGQVALAADDDWYKPYERDHVGAASLFYMNGTWVSDDKNYSEVWLMEYSLPYGLRRLVNENGSENYELVNFVHSSKRSAIMIRNFTNADIPQMTLKRGSYVIERRHQWEFRYTSNETEISSSYDCRDDNLMDLHLVKKQRDKIIFDKVIHLKRLTAKVWSDSQS